MKSTLFIAALFCLFSVSAIGQDDVKDTKETIDSKVDIEQLKEIDLVDIPSGTKIAFTRDFRVPANARKETLFFVDEYISFGEVLLKQPYNNGFTIKKGATYTIFRTENCGVKDYFGYDTKIYLFPIEKGEVTSFLITAPSVKMTLADIHEGDICDGIFEIVEIGDGKLKPKAKTKAQAKPAVKAMPSSEK